MEKRDIAPGDGGKRHGDSDHPDTNTKDETDTRRRDRVDPWWFGQAELEQSRTEHTERPASKQRHQTTHKHTRVPDKTGCERKSILDTNSNPEDERRKEAGKPGCEQDRDGVFTRATGNRADTPNATRSPEPSDGN
ncbi:hypothetical protein PM033_11995 [Halorubrum ezzemoulense]|nr:hypothetical protein [Halorubrum ezzemoulense]